MSEATRGNGSGLGPSLLAASVASACRALAGARVPSHGDDDTATGKVGWAGLGPLPGKCSATFLFLSFSLLAN
jgi:hypothetical protein